MSCGEWAAYRSSQDACRVNGETCRSVWLEVDVSAHDDGAVLGEVEVVCGTGGIVCQSEEQPFAPGGQCVIVAALDGDLGLEVERGIGSMSSSSA